MTSDIKHINAILTLPFAFQRLVFEEGKEPFILENVSNLTHEFLYNNLTIFFCLKKVIQKLMCQI